MRKSKWIKTYAAAREYAESEASTLRTEVILEGMTRDERRFVYGHTQWRVVYGTPEEFSAYDGGTVVAPKGVQA